MFKSRRNLFIFVIVLICVLLGIFGYLYKYYFIDTKHIDRVFQKNTKPKLQKTSNSNVSYLFDKNSINLLIVGLDKASNRSNNDLHRTDTILFVNINFKDKKIRGISIPRDTLTEIYNVNKWDKINSAFGYGGGSDHDGFFYTMETVSKLLGGLPIYYYVGFDLDAIRKVVNILGGVYVNVEVPVKVKTQWVDVDLKPGYQKLNGIETLYYALWRKTPGGDIDRIKRDKELILTVFQQLKESNKIIKLPEIYWKIRRHFYTNLTLQQVTSLALFSQNIKKEDIQMDNLPGDYYNYMGISYWKPNYDEIEKLVKNLLNCDIDISLQLPDKYKYSYTLNTNKKRTYTKKDNGEEVNNSIKNDNNLEKNPNSSNLGNSAENQSKNGSDSSSAPNNNTNENIKKQDSIKTDIQNQPATKKENPPNDTNSQNTNIDNGNSNDNKNEMDNNAQYNYDQSISTDSNVYNRQ